VLNTINMGIVIIDKDNSNNNYFNEYSQDSFTRALTLQQRFSLNAVNES